ncbi:DUF3352 domain-containing protein [Roseofilum casamattae]|uniref:DUF3352 domain-containing protein n=1 Tax=Roseofilum casamattae BLCC-M143 TaxID=3022442 RepID=A0ABT7C2E8_9CYAN|nr:DUF3352 domain-containing protein [Roseofilum casamattae]MDJ1185640.1 DUF3352 domain-containing protein [Roseofilum casamattae BLCC-M143]
MTDNETQTSPETPGTLAARKPLFLGIGIAALIVVGSSLAYWLFLGRGRVPADMQLGANVVPQDSLLTVSLSTNERQWEQLREFGTTDTQAAFDESLAQLRDQFQLQTQLDYVKDIQPWVGQEVTWAYLAPKTTLDEEDVEESEPLVLVEEPSWLIVVPIANPLKAKELSDKLVDQELTKRTYKDIEIQETQPDADVVFSSTVLNGRYLVMSSTPEGTNRAIDTFKGAPSVASTPGYKQALEQLSESSSFARLYVNIPEATKVAAANSVQPISPEELQQLQTNQGLAATMNVVTKGLLFKGVTWLSPQSEEKLTPSSSDLDLSAYVPDDTLMMLAGSDLSMLWSQYASGVEGNPLAPLNPEALQQGLSETTGLNLEEDILKWMDGEFAIAMIPAAEGTAGAIPFGFAVMANTSDRETADKTFASLDEVMQERYNMEISTETVAEKDVIKWTLPFGIVDISRSWLTDNLVVMTFGAPISDRIVSTPPSPLSTSQGFKSSLPQGLNSQSGYFYADMERLFNEDLPLPIILPPDRDNLFKAFDAIGVTAAVTSPRTTRYDLLLRLKQGNKPGPLREPVSSPAPAPDPAPAPSEEAAPEASESPATEEPSDGN